MHNIMEDEKIVLTLDPNGDLPKAQALAEEKAEAQPEVVPAPLDSSSFQQKKPKW